MIDATPGDNPIRAKLWSILLLGWPLFVRSTETGKEVLTRLLKERLVDDRQQGLTLLDTALCPTVHPLVKFKELILEKQPSFFPFDSLKQTQVFKAMALISIQDVSPEKVKQLKDHAVHPGGKPVFSTYSFKPHGQRDMLELRRECEGKFSIRDVEDFEIRKTAAHGINQHSHSLPLGAFFLHPTAKLKKNPADEFLYYQGKTAAELCPPESTPDEKERRDMLEKLLVEIKENNR